MSGTVGGADAIASHLRWGAYCCLRAGMPGRKRAWSTSALLVVDVMLQARELRESLPAFRLVHEAGKLIETGMLSAKYSYVLAARKDLIVACRMIEGDA